MPACIRPTAVGLPALIALVGTSSGCAEQGSAVVRGTVRDAVTGCALPSVAFLVELRDGTVQLVDEGETDGDGEFVIGYGMGAVPPSTVFFVRPGYRIRTYRLPEEAELVGKLRYRLEAFLQPE